MKFQGSAFKHCVFFNYVPLYSISRQYVGIIRSSQVHTIKTLVVISTLKVAVVSEIHCHELHFEFQENRLTIFYKWRKDTQAVMAHQVLLSLWSYGCTNVLNYL